MIFISEVRVVGEENVEIHLYLPYSSIRSLQSSCHQVLTSGEMLKTFGEFRYKRMLLDFLERSPSLRRSIFVQKAWFVRSMDQGMSAGYWDSLERHDSFIKLCRDILFGQVDEAGYEGDAEDTLEDNEPEYISFTDDEDQYNKNCDDFPYDTMAGV